MSDRSVEHATFSVERVYDAAPSRVFAAFTDPTAKAAWFIGDGAVTEYEMDFQVGGRELLRGRMADGRAYIVDACYHDIVEDERIVYAYTIDLDDTRISVSLATVQLRPDGGQTRLVLTEQGAYLDGHDTPRQRASGITRQLDALAATLDRT